MAAVMAVKDNVQNSMNNSEILPQLIPMLYIASSELYILENVYFTPISGLYS